MKVCMLVVTGLKQLKVTMATAKVWKLKNDVVGQQTISDFELVEETLPSELKENEILVEAVYLSVDPYMRFYVAKGKSLPGEQLARVIQSKAQGFPVGSLVKTNLGWRSRGVVNTEVVGSLGKVAEVIEEVPGLSPTLWLGAAGMPGVTAYLSFLDRCDPKPGEVIVVSAASGAVGAIVGSDGRLGIAGSADKCEYIKDIGYDVAINYKTDDISGALDKAAPSGVDIYYDNVGGEISDTVYSKLRENGRVLICGQISVYNRPAEEIKKATNWNYQILFKELTVRGFKVSKSHKPCEVCKLIQLTLCLTNLRGLLVDPIDCVCLTNLRRSALNLLPTPIGHYIMVDLLLQGQLISHQQYILRCYIYIYLIVMFTWCKCSHGVNENITKRMEERNK
ncbi:Prostaglandin reductase 1 [Bulinus truncatus]|nr:Prostaglandin reductase 1 [Bulinus truncatus]